MNLIDVIIPVYKVEQYLARCLDSVLGQTFPDFRLILVDDGSPDRCGAICEEYAAKDPRIHVIHRENGGLSAARNTGIEWAISQSDSQWITFLDSDDWVHPRYLELLYNAVVRTGMQAAVGGFRRTENDGDMPELPAEASEQIVNTEEFYCSDKVTATVAWGKLYRKEDFQEIRYPEGKIHEDELTTHKILFRYSQIAVVDRPIYQYFQNQAGIMRSGWSPKHIAEAEGMYDQLRFFRANGYQKAAACAARSYLNSLYRNLASAEADQRYSEQAKTLRRQLRDGLRHEHKLAGVCLKKDPWLYYAAYPIRTIPYRAWKKLFRKQTESKAGNQNV